MTDCGSVPPHLVSLENSRFSAVLGRWLGHGPWGFYRSTRFRGSGAPRRTKKQNILGRIDIPIMNSPTRRSGFTGGCPAVRDQHITAIPGGLVLHLPSELIQPAIGNGFAQAAVSQHPLDIQILQADHWVLVDERGGNLVQKIPAAVLNPGMDSGNAHLLPAPPVRALTLLAQTTLGHFQ
ncbi:hypothetical protein IB75_06165, partial [Nitrosococcus oceani C-27]